MKLRPTIIKYWVFFKIVLRFKCIQQNWCVMKVRNQGGSTASGRSNSFFTLKNSWMIVNPV